MDRLSIAGTAISLVSAVKPVDEIGPNARAAIPSRR